MMIVAEFQSVRLNSFDFSYPNKLVLRILHNDLQNNVILGSKMRHLIGIENYIFSSDDHGVQLGDGHGQVGESIQHPKKVNIVN